MKKIVSFISAAAMIFGFGQTVQGSIGSLSALTAYAEDTAAEEGSYENMTYNRYSDHIEITGCAEDITELVIPPEIGGLPVTHIKDFAFESHENLTSVVLPESIVYTGKDSFAICSNLSSVTLPDSLEEIMIGTFDYCTSLKSIKLPANLLRLRAGVFSYCTSLEEVIFPDHQVDVYSNVFLETPWLKARQEEAPLVIVDGTLIDGTTCKGDVVIPDDVTIISSGAFSLNFNITSVVVPKGVKDIWDETFYYCGSLRSVELKGAEYIGPRAFGGCSELTDIKLPSELQTIDSDAFFECLNTSAIITFRGTQEQWKQVDIKDKSLIFYIAKMVYAPEKTEGDINGDGAFGVADAVTLQKWLLADASADVKNWELADLCRDERLDVFDLVAMRKKLTELS